MQQLGRSLREMLIGPNRLALRSTFLESSSCDPSCSTSAVALSSPMWGEISRRWATKKVGGSSRNGRGSKPQHRGIKEAENTQVKAGYVLARQLGFKWHPGFGVNVGRDGTLYSEYDGTVRFVHWNVRVQRKGQWELHRRVYMCVEPTPEEAAKLVKAAPPGVEARPPQDVIAPFTKDRLLQLTLKKVQLPADRAQLLPPAALPSAAASAVDPALIDRAFAASEAVIKKLAKSPQ